jgi:hypothetical protein
MKAIRIYSILFLALLLVSCSRQVIYDGHVYSKHHYPMANLVVDLRCTDDGKSPHVKAYSLVTDENGRFVFNQKIRKGRQIPEIVIHSDSISNGSVFSMPTGGADNMRDLEIVLE